MRSVSIAAAWVGVAALLSGCAARPQAQMQIRDGADFSAYKTYSLLPLPESGPSSDPGLMLRIAGPLRAAVAESMAAQGYSAVEKDAADFTLNVRGESIPRTDVTDWGYSSSYTFGPRGGVYFPPYRDVTVRNYEEQSLIVEAYDNRSKDLVWVGWIKRSNYGSKVTTEDVVSAARQVIATFPPRAGASEN